MNLNISYCNGEFLTPENDHCIYNRGFLYGDGIFETILYENNTINYLTDHYERLIKGTRLLSLEFNYSLKQIAFNITELLNKLNLKGDTASIKVIVYRNYGGLYTPSNMSSSLIITAKRYKKENIIVKKLGVSLSTNIAKSKNGNIKTLSALPYVLASLEKNNSIDFDELVLLNTNNEICECTSTNIFWRIDNTYYTPCLSTGCIEGVMRKQVINNLTQEGNKVIEGCFNIKDLSKADSIFLTNVFGIRSVHHFTP